MPSDLIRGWTPIRVKKTRQIKNLEPRSDSIGTEKALALGHFDETAHRLGPVGSLPDQHGLDPEGGVNDRPHSDVLPDKTGEALGVDRHAKTGGYQTQQCQRVR